MTDSTSQSQPGPGTHVLDTDVLVTDVLVIGGGPAATWAAVTAREAGVDVVLVDKGYCGASGVAAAAGIGHWLVPPDPELREAATRQRAELGSYLTDRTWQERVLDQTWNRLPVLADWRYPFPAGADGRPVYRTGSGPEYLRTMRNQVKRSGARILDHHPALELLTRDGAVVGANGIERTTGRPWTIRARAVVLATGGCTWKSYSLGSNVDTGDGQLMAAEVGATLAAMEFSNFWGMVPKGTSMDKNGFYGFATFTTEDGTELPDGLNGDRGRLARYMLEGPVYAQLDRVPADMVTGVRGRMINWRQTFDKLGLDPITQRFEIDMVNEGTVRGTGGLFVGDTDCSVGVPGLYAAGDVAARDRITGSHTGAGAPNAAWALSSGNWAGRAAAQWARSTGPGYNSGPAEPAGRAGLRPAVRPGPSDEWQQVTAAVQDQLLPIAKNAVRTEAILLDSLSVLDDAWRTARQSLHATGPEVLRAREAAAMTAMGRWAYRSALARTESRGMHYRADHPRLDEGQRTRIHSGGLDEVWVRTEPLAEGAWAERADTSDSSIDDNASINHGDNLVRSAS